MPTMGHQREKTFATEDEWAKAKAYFRTNHGATKLAKGKSKNEDTGVDTSLKHSFVKINGTIYAMEKRHKGGGEATIKTGQTEDGTTVAIRVTGSKTPENTILVMQKLGKLTGVASRKAQQGKKFKGKAITEKSYEAVELIPGRDLSKVLNENNLDQSQKYKAALMAANCIQKMHDKGVIHLDIKAENFMIDLDNNGKIKSLNEVDYGFAAIVDNEGKFYIGKDESRGTQGFMAPEVEAAQPATTASDVYSFGQMLKLEMGIDAPIIDEMLNSDPSERPDMQTVIKELQKLTKANQHNHKKENSNLLDQVKNFEAANDDDKIRILAKLVTLQHQDKEAAAELFKDMDTGNMSILIDYADNLVVSKALNDASKRGFAVAATGLMRNELYNKISNSDMTLSEKCQKMKGLLQQQLQKFKYEQLNKIIENAKSFEELKSTLSEAPEMESVLDKVQKYEIDCLNNTQEANNNYTELANKFFRKSASDEIKTKLAGLMPNHMAFNQLIDKAESFEALRTSLLENKEMEQYLKKIEEYENDCFAKPQEAINNSAKVAVENIQSIESSTSKDMKKKLNRLMIAHLDSNFNPMANPDISLKGLMQRLEKAQQNLESQRKVGRKATATNTAPTTQPTKQEAPKDNQKQENKGPPLSMFQRTKQKLNEVKKDAKKKIMKTARSGTSRLKQ